MKTTDPTSTILRHSEAEIRTGEDTEFEEAIWYAEPLWLTYLDRLALVGLLLSGIVITLRGISIVLEIITGALSRFQARLDPRLPRS